MRRSSIAALVLAAAAVGLSAPGAWAQGGSGSNITSFGFSAFPTTVQPGGTVAFAITGCSSTGSVSAPALFNTVNLTGNSTKMTGTTTVGTGVNRGATYQLTFTCGTESGTTPLMIASSGSTATPTPSASASAGSAATAPAGAVKTGDGGSITDNPAEMAGGLALLALAGTGVALRMRRRGSHGGS
ncbi:hypothetical protein [Streptacidiphilus sp. EB129]|uniref:hypothetical protein n=1 Tax=Streptacidiphilus sp. EB129 TaxID=3156262 RepID=UPI00351131F5